MFTKSHDLSLVARLKASPDRLIVTDSYIAMHCVDIEQTILIPGDFRGVTYARAKIIFDENLKQINK